MLFTFLHGFLLPLLQLSSPHLLYSPAAVDMHFVVAVQQICGIFLTATPPLSCFIIHPLLLCTVPLTMSVADEALDQVYVRGRVYIVSPF